MTATDVAPAPITDATVSRVIPPMATTGSDPAQACRGRHEVESNRRIASVLRSSPEHRTHGKIADGLDARGLNLLHGMGGEADDRVSAKKAPSRRGSEIVLPHVHARRAGKRGNVGTVVDDDGCSAARGSLDDHITQSEQRS